MHGAFSRLREAAATPILAIANRRIFSKGACEAWSLAPTDVVFLDFLRELRRLLPEAGQAETRIRSLSPNDVAVVLWIAVGDTAVLLGSDLEQRGWLSVLQDTARRTGTASVFKVPHHGGASAHEPGVWEHMLDREPVAVLVPWRRGGSVLPTRRDRQRILASTPNAFMTAGTGAPTAAPRRSSVIERTIRQSGIRLRRIPEPDAIRLRRRIGSGTQWRVERFGSACHLSAFGGR